MIASYLVLVASLVLLVLVEGLNPFVLWNALPILFGVLMRGMGEPPRARLAPSFAFIVGAASVSACFHLAWLFDYHRIATGGSTAGLIFIFIPFLAALGGTVCAGLAFLFGRRRS